MASPAHGTESLGATTIAELSPACLVAVFSHLAPADAARGACVCCSWAAALRDELLWRRHLGNVFSCDEPVLPSGDAAPTHRTAFLAWVRHFAGVPLPLAARALRMWRALRGWTRAHAPFIADSLRPGAGADEVARAEKALGVKLPDAVAAILRVHDGQALEFDSAFDAFMSWRLLQEGFGGDDTQPPEPVDPPPRWHPTMVWGLFGGYSFYDHLASLRLFPLERAVRWTAFFRHHAHTSLPPELVVLGGSANLGKVLLVDTSSGALLIGGVQDHMPAAPVGGPLGASDCALRWMEEWGRRLEGGWYEVAELGAERRTRARGVCLFPVVAPPMAAAVTRGIQVRVSSVFAPEMSGNGPTRHFFGYNVRFALLPAERQAALDGGGDAGGCTDAPAGSDQSAEAGSGALARVQLESRHWRILDAGGALVKDIRGEGVVGEFPLLQAGGPEFAYASCTHQEEPSGAMEGAFRFVEGSLAVPTGRAIDAVCPRFELRVPDYIY